MHVPVQEERGLLLLNISPERLKPVVNSVLNVVYARCRVVGDEELDPGEALKHGGAPHLCIQVVSSRLMSPTPLEPAEAHTPLLHHSQVHILQPRRRRRRVVIAKNTQARHRQRGKNPLEYVPGHVATRNHHVGLTRRDRRKAGLAVAQYQELHRFDSQVFPKEKALPKDSA